MENIDDLVTALDLLFKCHKTSNSGVGNLEFWDDRIIISNSDGLFKYCPAAKTFTLIEAV